MLGLFWDGCCLNFGVVVVKLFFYFWNDLRWFCKELCDLVNIEGNDFFDLLWVLRIWVVSDVNVVLNFCGFKLRFWFGCGCINVEGFLYKVFCIRCVV